MPVAASVFQSTSLEQRMDQSGLPEPSHTRSERFSESEAADEFILKPVGPWGVEAEQRAGLETSFGNDKII